MIILDHSGLVLSILGPPGALPSRPIGGQDPKRLPKAVPRWALENMQITLEGLQK